MELISPWGIRRNKMYSELKTKYPAKIIFDSFMIYDILETFLSLFYQICGLKHPTGLVLKPIVINYTV